MHNRWFPPLGVHRDRRGRQSGLWFDYIGTKPDTYLEQARQTVLGGAREMMLFRYDALAHHAEGKELMGAFNAELPALFKLARIIRKKTVRGIAIPRALVVLALSRD